MYVFVENKKTFIFALSKYIKVDQKMRTCCSTYHLSEILEMQGLFYFFTHFEKNGMIFAERERERERA